MEIIPKRESERIKPWKERIPVLGRVRRFLRNALFGAARKAIATDDGRDMLTEALAGIYAQRGCRLAGPGAERPLYPGLGVDKPAAGGTGTVFVTGRFRSGSTLLWNLFRYLNSFTSYYEPYNERRWFDPATRGSRTDPTHRKVSDYWTEYEGLTQLGRYYRETWTCRNLLMDEDAWDPDLLAYTRLLVARAPGRAMLQCNRIDFRLPWFRRHFPEARIVHLYRHPRDQWCSALMDSRFPPGGTVEQFKGHDRFYLLSWCCDLKYHFPFLDERCVQHPYQLFYYLWKLSYLFGRRYAHHSLSMEELVERPEAVLSELFQAVGIDPTVQEMQKLLSLVERPELDKWRGYAEEGWFQRHESVCEATLADFVPPARERPDGNTCPCRADP